MKPTVVHFMVGLALTFAFAETARSETHRISQHIGDSWYTVDYVVQPNGFLTINLTHVMKDNTWVAIDPKEPKVQPAGWGDGVVVSLGGKNYAVRFATVNGKVVGDNYAKYKEGEWKFYNPEKEREEMGQKVAEMRVPGEALSPFSLTSVESKSFTDDKGHDIHPKINFTTRPEIRSSKNSMALGVNVDVNGIATSGGAEQHFGRMIGANVTTHINGRHSQEVRISPDGADLAGSLRGGVNITNEVEPFSIKIRNGKAGRLGTKRAANQAWGEAMAKIPETKQRLAHDIGAQVAKSVSDGNSMVQKYLKEMTDMNPKLGKIDMPVRFSSEAAEGGASGTLNASVIDSDKERARSRLPRPALNDAEGKEASLFVHQDVLTKVISEQLSGEKIRLDEAMKRICTHSLMKRLPLCNEKMKPKTGETMLTFDKDRPFVIEFKEGHIRLELNAAHTLFNKDSKGKERVAYDVESSKVEIDYLVTPEGLERTLLRAGKNLPPGALAKVAEKPAEPVKDEKTHQAGFSSFIPRAFKAVSGAVQDATTGTIKLANEVAQDGGAGLARAAAGYVEDSTLVMAYSDAFSKEVPFKTLEVPATTVQEDPTGEKKNTVTSMAAISTHDVKADNGWLGMSFKMKVTK